MAIPFNLPSDEETEESYRRLDQLLLDLYDVLRQILLRRSISRGHAQFPVPDVHPPTTHRAPRQTRQAPLPDLIPTAGAARKPPVAPPRRRRRRPAPEDTKDCSSDDELACRLGAPLASLCAGRDGPAPVLHCASEPLLGGPSWLNVGIELRQIAEEFRTRQNEAGEEETLEHKRHEVKASSLFSLLAPAPLTGSLWTTVIILVGWRILARSR